MEKKHPERKFEPIDLSNSDNLIVSSILNNASDIHLEPIENGLRIRFRIEGSLYEVDTIPWNNSNSQTLVNKLKVMADLDLSNTRLPQEGRADFEHDKVKVNLRFATMPQLYGEKMVIRLYNIDKISKITKLGMNEYTLNKFKDLISGNYGMVLVTGPTGSGKSTTLYAALNYLNNSKKNLMTIEDPIEIPVKFINQIQVNSKIGLNFKDVLRSILRLDPNIIMIGEIRDTETVELAINAAQTGHLVISTLHTSHSIGTITRLLDMGIPDFQIISSLRGIVAQKLINMICPHCKEEIESLLNKVRSFIGKGCPKCFNTGFKERIPVFEILILSDGFKRQILESPNEEELSLIAANEGFITMKKDALIKANEGLITLPSALSVTDEPLHSSFIKE